MSGAKILKLMQSRELGVAIMRGRVRGVVFAYALVEWAVLRLRPGIKNMTCARLHRDFRDRQSGVNIIPLQWVVAEIRLHASPSHMHDYFWGKS